MHCNCCHLGWVESRRTEEGKLECEGGSQRMVGGTEGVAAGAGVSGDRKGLGRHMGSPLVLEDVPGKEDRVSGRFRRSTGLISNHDYPGGGKERAFFSRSVPWALPQLFRIWRIAEAK